MQVSRGGKFVPAPMPYFMRFHGADGTHACNFPRDSGLVAGADALNISRRFRKQIVAGRRVMRRAATRFGLIITVAVLAAAKLAAQQAPSDADPPLQPSANNEAPAVKRVVDGIMQPYLAQEQRRATGHLWRRSPYLGAIVAVSLHGHRYFFPYGKATEAGAPFTRDTVVEIGSCTKTFTTTLFAPGHQPSPNRP